MDGRTVGGVGVGWLLGWEGEGEAADEAAAGGDRPGVDRQGAGQQHGAAEDGEQRLLLEAAGREEVGAGDQEPVQEPGQAVLVERQVGLGGEHLGDPRAVVLTQDDLVERRDRSSRRLSASPAKHERMAGRLATPRPRGGITATDIGARDEWADVLSGVRARGTRACAVRSEVAAGAGAGASPLRRGGEAVEEGHGRFPVC